jgi:DNA-binding NtrC family response regulator
MESVHVLAQGNVIQFVDLPVRVRGARPAAVVPPTSTTSTTLTNSASTTTSDLCLAEVEKRTIEEALRRTNQCKAAASRLLGINIQRLNRRIAKLSISLR